MIARHLGLGNKAPPGRSHLLRAGITELIGVRLGEPADHLFIESWHCRRGVTRRVRR